MKKLLVLMMPAMWLVACKKEETSPKAIGNVLDGTYNGVVEEYLKASGSNGTFSGPIQFYVQLTISGNNFQSGNTNPYQSMGACSLQVSGTDLDFTNINAIADATTPPPLLSGNYNYTINGDSLLLSPTPWGVDVITTYKLKKQ